MSKRNLTKSHREAMVVALGNRCVNCGSEECIEYHHIVPIHLGGADKLSNMVALCNRCHKAAHNGRHIRNYKNNDNGGRKRIVGKDAAYSALDLYFSGSIGSRKCKELLGLSKTCQVKDSPYLREYLVDNGIVEYKNIVDIIATNRNRGLKNGDVVGRVKYTDGSEKVLIYKHTGMNDVEYVRRAQ